MLRFLFRREFCIAKFDNFSDSTRFHSCSSSILYHYLVCFYVLHFNFCAAKYSTLHLAVKDILRKDLKTLFGDRDLCIGISSVTASAKDFLSKDGAHERTLAFAKHNSMHAVIIMFIHTEDSKAIRELAVCSLDDKLLQSILTNLLEKDDLQLQLQRELENMKIFSQGNSMVSRKVLSPYIMNFLSDV